MDPALDPSDRETPLCYRGHPAIANRSPSIGRANTIKTWLSMWSLETSRCQGRPHLSKLTVPALVVQGMADTGVFPSDARKIHDFIGSQDKTLRMTPGAHYFEDSRSNRENAVEIMCEWIEQRG
jgi:esterase/lipase